MTLLVRNEADVLDTHLRYHLSQGVDELIVTDNLSTDETPAILDRYAREGHVRVIEEPSDDYSQSRWVTRMARLAAVEHGADWVLHADADEFFVAEEGTVKEALAAVPRWYGKMFVPRLNFRPRPESTEPLLSRLVVRDAEATNPLGRPLPAKVCHRARRRVVVDQGNHDVKNVRLWRMPDAPLVIFHYPTRSYEQIERKVRLGGAAVARNRTLEPNAGLHWVRMLEMLESGRLREWYEQQLVADDALDAGLESGELVLDTRLAERVAALA